MSGGWHTVGAALTGWVAGWVYLRAPLLQEWLQVPEAVVRVVQPALDRLGLADTTVAAPAVRGGVPAAAAAAAAARPAAQQRQQQQQLQQEQQQQLLPDPPAPDPAAIEQLTNMGFPRPRVLEALRLSHNNVEHAANRLLTDS